MPERGFSRFIPLVAILALLGALATFYGPGILRAWKFRTTVEALLGDVKAGNLNAVPTYVLANQRSQASAVLRLPIAQDAVHEIGSLKLTNYFREEDHMWSIVTAKQKDGSLIGQGKLRWEWQDDKWQLNWEDSTVTAGVGVSDENWTRLGDMVHLVDESSQ